MRRRAFIAWLGSAAGWPLVAQSQQPGRVRRIRVLMAVSENDPLAQPWIKLVLANWDGGLAGIFGSNTVGLAAMWSA